MCKIHRAKKFPVPPKDGSLGGLHMIAASEPSRTNGSRRFVPPERFKVLNPHSLTKKKPAERFARVWLTLRASKTRTSDRRRLERVRVGG